MDWIRIGRSLHALRIQARLTQIELAHRAGVPRDHVALIERGHAADVRLASIERVAAALGASIDLRIRWRGEHLDRLMDEAHAATIAATVARLRRFGWVAAVEVSFSIWGERGSIDVLAWHEPTRTLLVIEVKSVLADLQSLLHGLDRKARLGWEIGSKRGWRAAAVGRMVVLAESPTSRGRVARVSTVLDAALPARGPDLRRWLAAPAGPVAGLMFLSNAGQHGIGRPIWRRERVRSRRRHSRGADPAPTTAEAALDKDAGGEARGRGPAVDQ